MEPVRSLLLLLSGCPAAQLGIELPPEGMEAISAEDLRRDTDLVQRDGAAGWRSRMEQMSATSMPGERVCMRQGDGNADPLWSGFSGTGTVTVGEAVDAAALISIAKAWDTLGEKPGPRVYCLGEGDGTRLIPFAPNAKSTKDIDLRVLASTLRRRAL